MGYPAQQRRYIPKTAKHEESIQLQICRYLKMQYPRVIFRSDFASGLHLTMAQAAKHKRLQSGRAFPDLFIYHPMQHKDKLYHGLALELKREGTAIIVSRGPRKGHLVADTHVQEQYLLLKQLKELGYYADFGIGFDQTVKIIDWYMRKPRQENGQLF